MNHGLAILSALAYGATVALSLRLHRHGSADTWLRQPVSAYANGPQARLFMTYGLVGIVAAGLLAAAMAGRGFPRLAVVCLAAMAALRIGVFALRTGDGTAARAAESRVHLALAVVTFTLACQAVSSGTPRAGELVPSLAPLFRGLAWIAALSLAGVVATGVVPALRRWFGLAERLFLGATLAWFALLAAGLASVP